jgi:hypothetical protein
MLCCREVAMLCIYCKSECTGSREHALQKSLGGNLVIREVCGKCNGSFSAIDQSLAENSLLGLMRVGITKPGMFDVQLGGDHFRENEVGYWEELRIINGMQPVVLPQIHLIGTQEDGQSRISTTAGELDELKGFIALVSEQVADGRILSTHIKTGPSPQDATPRLVGYRSNALFVRAPSTSDGESFLKLLVANWPTLRAQVEANWQQQPQVVHQPTVRLSQAIRIDDNYRAIAKTAFNVLAIKRGASFVLRSEFDPLRDYIRGIALVHKQTLAPGEIAVDTRFVQSLPFGEVPLVPISSHAVIIVYHAPALLAFVTLYSKYSFVVRLAEIELPMQLIEAHEFSIDRTSNSDLTMEELAKRILERKADAER